MNHFERLARFIPAELDKPSGRFEQAQRDIERFGKEFFVIGDVEITLFELAWHLTGLEKSWWG